MANTCMLGLPLTGGDVGTDGQNPVTDHINGRSFHLIVAHHENKTT